MPLEFVPVTRPAQIAGVATLAQQIWEEFYVPLIGRAQVEYMVAKFQSPDAIRQQIGGGYDYFLAQRGDVPVGYFAVKAESEEKCLFLSKLYVRKTDRGAGTGRACMEFIEQLACRRGLALLRLTVNKGNPSVRAYERLGFRVVADIVIDIGNGFVMDDYRMEKRLSAAAMKDSRTGDVH